MATTKLDLFNDALHHLGERRLSSLTEVRKPRRELDVVWDRGGVDFCLEQAQWHFAMRTVLLDYDPAVEPSFGYSRAFEKPGDWKITSAVCSDEFFNSPLTAYSDESGYWYADIDQIYVKYVSNDAAYGMDMNEWPATFTEYVALYFAERVCLAITQDESKLEKLVKLTERAKLTAENKAAMASPTSFPAQGAWVKARLGTRNNERGNRHSLIG